MNEIEELRKLLERVTDALDDTTEKFNYGIYDDLIKESREKIKKLYI